MPARLRAAGGDQSSRTRPADVGPGRTRRRLRRAVLDRRTEKHNHMVVDSLSATLAAVADPTRRTILRRLAGGPATVGDLARPFRISQQAVSKHLLALERARLIRKQRHGREHVCTIDARPIQEVVQWAGEFQRFWTESFDRLDALLVQLKAKEKRRERKN